MSETKAEPLEGSITIDELFNNAYPAAKGTTHARMFELTDGPHGQRLLFLMHGDEAAIVAGVVARFLDNLIDAAQAREADNMVSHAEEALAKTG